MGINKGILSLLLTQIYPTVNNAISILSKYGGSLWVADPAYTFTGSDGTGAASDGSDTGYVRDLVSNARPLFQSTTGFKPKLKRVPKKLGPEIIVDNSFEGTSGWVLGGGFSIAGGQLTANAVATNQSAYRQLSDSTLQAGKSYQFEIVCSSYTSGTYALLSTGGGNPIGDKAAAGTFTGVLNNSTAGAVYVWAKQPLTAVFDSISVREVLEWGWAWVFDGADDVLATVSQPTAAAETLIICADVSAAAAQTARVRIEKADSTTGLRIYGDTAPFYALHYAAAGAQFTPCGGASDKRGVATLRVAAGAQATRMNGVQYAVKSTNYVSGALPVKIGNGIYGASAMNVFAAAYIPGAPTNAELLIVERAIGALAGVKI